MKNYFPCLYADASVIIILQAVSKPKVVESETNKK